MLAILGIGGWEMVLILTIVLILSAAKFGSEKGQPGEGFDLNTTLLLVAGALAAFFALAYLVNWLKV
jgi:multisubunit Na+/H+ antiporter MnhB subunit